MSSSLNFSLTSSLFPSFTHPVLPYTMLYMCYMKSVCFDLFCSFSPYQDNKTPLFVASEKGDRNEVKRLLGAGADVNIARSSVSDLMFNKSICGLRELY